MSNGSINNERGLRSQPQSQLFEGGQFCEDGLSGEGIDNLLESVVSLGLEAIRSDDLFSSLTREEDDLNVVTVDESWRPPAKSSTTRLNPPDAGEPPDTGVSAQVVLIVTSLGSFRRQFFDSRRAQHFLDCKGLVYHLIDTNRDVSQGIDLIDQELLKAWDTRGLLAKQDDNSEKPKLAIPQILIDGVYIGDGSALQDLEEDGDLDWIAARAACPACLNEREPSENQCRHCCVDYVDLIPEHVVSLKQVQRFSRGQQYAEDAPFQRHLTYKEAIQQHEPQDEPQALTYESLFGEPPPEDY